MKNPRALAVVAVVFGLALSGCQTPAGSLNPGSVPSVAIPSSAALSAIIQGALEDRNGAVLDTPPAPRLPQGQMTAAYRTKRARDLPVVERSKARLKSAGFWYTSFSTTVTVASVEGIGSKAIVHFKEQTEQYLASTANGPSNVPSGYSLPETATFLPSADGWQLESIEPSEQGGGLPMSIVKG